MFTIRLFIAGVALLTAALTTVVTVAPQPASAEAVACTELPEPVLA
jgi:hypothetical protein